MEKIIVKKFNGWYVEKVLLWFVMLLICIVQVEIDGVSYYVVDEKGQIVCFNGVEYVNNVFGKMIIDKVVLVYNLFYVEMVGQLEDGLQFVLEVDFNWCVEKV